MKVRFTKASKKDFNLITVSLSALEAAGVNIGAGSYSLEPTYLGKNEEFALTIYQGNNGNRRKVHFRVNRAARTATTTNWPFSNRPRVGKAVLYSVASAAELIKE